MIPLSNDWITWIWTTFSMVIVAVPSLVIFTLKLVAIFHPNIPTDKVIDLFKEYWPKGKASTE